MLCIFQIVVLKIMSGIVCGTVFLRILKTDQHTLSYNSYTEISIYLTVCNFGVVMEAFSSNQNSLSSTFLLIDLKWLFCYLLKKKIK